MNKIVLNLLGVAGLVAMSLGSGGAPAFGGEIGPDFCKNFKDSTLRIDYIFGGGPSGVHIMLDGQSKSGGWAGKRFRLDKAPFLGNGTIMVIDATSKDTLYCNSFSSLFQEWLTTPEASQVEKSFENTFLVPLPKSEADICVVLRDNRQKEIAKLTHRFRPNDELIALKGHQDIFPIKYIHKGGDPENCIDVAMVAEGYTVEEMDSFINHAIKAAQEILSYEPYSSYKDKFNFVAVMVPSLQSGVSIPLKKKWVDTALGSHFSTFYSARYLTTPNVKKLHDVLSGIPYEHVMILVNTDNYGGGGIYNSYHIAATRNKHSLPVTVHEFGHSFGGLGDEYFYDNEDDGSYPADIEPWEPNITTLVNFDAKWKDMVSPGIPIPTPWEDAGGDREKRMKHKTVVKEGAEETVGVYEGGGGMKKGVYRPALTCRMRDNYHPTFCPVCQEALKRLIEFYTLPE